MKEGAEGKATPVAGSHGIAWSVGASAASQGLHLVLRLVLARLLAPGDFGLVAMAMAVVSFTWWAQDLSFGQALIQRRTLTDAEKSSAFWANVLAGCLLFLVLAGLSPLIAAFFRARELTPVLQAIGLSVVLSAPENTVGALLRREFRFRAVAVRQMGSVALGGSAGIALALAGFGAWALVGDALVRSAAGSLLMLLQSPWRPSLHFSGRDLAALWGFSRPLVGARLLNTLNRNIDTLLVGRVLGAGALGVYNLSYQFVLLPLTYFARAVNDALFVALCRLQDDEERFAAVFAHALHLLVLVSFPLMTLVALASPVLVPAVLGSRWEGAVPLLPFMCLAGAVQSLHALIPGVLQARARTSSVLLWVLLTTAATTVAVLCGVVWGVRGVAIAYALATVGMSLAVMPVLFRSLGLRVADLAALVGRTSACCLGIVLAWAGTGLVADGRARLPPLLAAGLQAGAGGAVYVALCLWVDPLFRHVRSRRSFVGAFSLPRGGP